MSVPASNAHSSVAVVFLLRWDDATWREHAVRFMRSYQAFHAGIDHRLYVALKGFETAGGVEEAGRILGGLDHQAIVVPEEGRDIGAYLAISQRLSEARVCFLNSHSEILGGHWLLKLDRNLDQPRVGMVGATGSYESLHALDPVFPAFPNPHLRTNAFMVDVSLFRDITADVKILGRRDAFLFESGQRSMTHRVLSRGLRVLTVGRNGRGYDVDWWPWSNGFRQGGQENLLVGDNQTRNFEILQRPERELMVRQTWGRHGRRDVLPGA